MLQVLLHYSMILGYKLLKIRNLQGLCERTENLCVRHFQNNHNPHNLLILKTLTRIHIFQECVKTLLHFLLHFIIKMCVPKRRFTQNIDVTTPCYIVTQKVYNKKGACYGMF